MLTSIQLYWVLEVLAVLVGAEEPGGAASYATTQKGTNCWLGLTRPCTARGWVEEHSMAPQT